MHKTYADKGLVVISLSLDPLYDAEDKRVEPAKEKQIGERVLKKLTDNRVNFNLNLILDEPTDVWLAKLQKSIPPTVFVFDRQGKWTRFVPEGEDPIDHAAVEKHVTKLLAE